MRLSAAGLGVFLALVGCGKSAVDAGAGGTTSEPMAGAPSDSGGSSGGTSSASGSSAVAGSVSAGTSGGGTTSAGGTTSFGGEVATGGEAPSGGSGNDALVDCDPKKVLCKVAAPTCAGFTVPEVIDGCYGGCVNIARCACDSADDCPDQNQFTCWSKQHCGPFLQ